MTPNRLFSARTLALLAASMMLSWTAMAAETLPRVALTDVALADGGVLMGQLIDAQRQPLAAQEVRVRFQDQVIAAVVTNDRGQFTIRGLRGGTHTLETAAGSNSYQLWAPRTAPPSAQQLAVVVADAQPIVRGQDDKACQKCTGKGCGACGVDRNKRLRRLVLLGLGAGGLAWALDHNDPGS